MKKNVSKFLIVVAAMFCFPLAVSAEDTSCNRQWSARKIETASDWSNSRGCHEHYEDCHKNPKAHDWSNWYTTQGATISKTGKKERFCYECFTEETKKSAKLKPYVKFSKKTVSLKRAQKQTLRVNYAKGDSVKSWHSSNRKIATVSKKGTITAKKSGTAKITVKMKSGKKATCTVKVSNKKASSKSNSRKVYWTSGGSVYHCTKNCPTLSRSRSIKNGSVSGCP